MTAWPRWRRFIIILFLCRYTTATDGNVGCLFTSYVCNDFEWCYDDYAFGRCLPSVGQLGPEDLYRFDTSPKSQLIALENEMERLYLLGYKWRHIYTQCILQSLLDAVRLNEEFNRSVCERDLDIDLQDALSALDDGGAQSDPSNVAVVKFRPDDDGAQDWPSEYEGRQLEERNIFNDGLFDEYQPGQLAARSLNYPDRLKETYQKENAELENQSEKLKKSFLPTDTKYKSHFRTANRVMSSDNEHETTSSDSDENMKALTSEGTTGQQEGGNNETKIKDEDNKEAQKANSDNREVIPPDFLQRYHEDPKIRDDDISTGQSLDLKESSAKKDGRGAFSSGNVGNNYYPRQSYYEGLSNFRQPDEEDIGNLRYLLADIDLLNKMERTQALNSRSRDSTRTAADYTYLRDNMAGPQPLTRKTLGMNVYPNNPQNYLEYEGLTPEDIFGTDRGNVAKNLQEQLAYDELVRQTEEYYPDYVYNESLESPPILDLEDLENRIPLNTRSDYLEDLNSDNEFERLERLDVKKPGPEFDPHVLEIVEKQEILEKPQGPLEEKEISDYIQKELIQRLMNNIESMTDDDKQDSPGKNSAGDASSTQKQQVDLITTSKPKRGQKEIPSYLVSRKHDSLTSGINYEKYDNPSNYDIVDMSYGYITVDEKFKNWEQGADLIKYLEKLLGLSAGTFSNIGVQDQQVTFKVNPNNQEYDTSTVSEKIESLKDHIMTETGIKINTAGIGDLGQVSRSFYEPDDKKLHIVIFALCGVVSAAVLSVAIFFIVHHQRKANKKLKGVEDEETTGEASRDYQDLCRARMASKNPEKQEVTVQKVPGVGKDHDVHNGSPHSSRSSTSSWSEEPVTSNMDISTGHMVLAYMEDHMKNKDRLEQEWLALCAYEAEPCKTDVAMKDQNKTKNRTVEVLPYDHSRVVLNDLTNMSQSDYINASTITDHDPRNPAYITAQSPLPHTAPDFWQMIWEQGAVVIVMLTRLQENGTTMCYRYWPEVGSDTYNIYEVHLVSEHIWCEDYMVRSFYLKNLKTSETRTVTQFHFLSWPENGTPTSTKALLEFRRKVNKSYRGRSCPIVVHCSDGAGRTGTYVLIDMVLSRMAKGAKEIDIAATLEHIRDQRPNMVRTKQQFEFVLVAVAEEVHAILKALPK